MAPRAQPTALFAVAAAAGGEAAARVRLNHPPSPARPHALPATKQAVAEARGGGGRAPAGDLGAVGELDDVVHLRRGRAPRLLGRAPHSPGAFRTLRNRQTAASQPGSATCGRTCGVLPKVCSISSRTVACAARPPPRSVGRRPGTPRGGAATRQ